MKKTFSNAILLFIILAFTSCYSSTIISEVSTSDTTIEGEMTITKSMNTYFWGAMRAEAKTNLCNSGTLHKVEVKSSLLNSALNVLTIGIYNRTTVECTCAKAIED